MALKRKLTKDEFEKLGETQKDLYKEKDGSYSLDLEGGEDLEGKVTALKASLDKAFKERDEAKKATEAFKDVDPEKYQQLLAEAEQRESDDLKSKGKYDEIIDKHNAKLAQVNKDWQTRIDAKDKELDKVYIDLRLRKVFEDAGVIADRIDDAVELTKTRAKRNEKGDLILMDKDGSALDVSPETYAKELLKEQKPWLYAASGAGGSGAPPNGGGAAGGPKAVKRPDFDKLSPAQQIAVVADVRAGKAQVVD